MICLALALLVSLVTAVFSESPIHSDEEILFLPGFAYPNPAGRWVVRLRGYVYEPENDSRKRRVLLSGLRSALDVPDDGLASRMLAQRARLFLVDHQRGKKIRVNLRGRKLHLPESRSNGQLRGSFLLPAGSFRQELLLNRNPRQPFFAAARDGRKFSGEIHIVDAVGVSVISDIDDTIKISRVLDKSELIRRTFLKEFEAVPGLAKLYSTHARAGHAFHYVSGSPWQLYPALEKFQKRMGFPDGSYHLRELRLKSILSFVDADPFAYKIETISSLLRELPRREFVLIGDSGEKDPEVYTTIAQKFERQVRGIFIRDIRSPGEIEARIRKLRAKIPRTRFVVFREASEIASVRF